MRAAAEPRLAEGAVEAADADAAVYGFVAAVGAGDAVSAAACFTRKGCLVTPDGTAVHGRADIARLVAQLISRRTEVEIEQLAIRPAGDVALATGYLKMRSDAAEGARIAQGCEPTVVLRRVEGTWKIAILAPWAFHERH
jgi:uncharacterized protein (TIGR02246 family)